MIRYRHLLPQGGSVLIITLLLLTMLTIMAVSGVQLNKIQANIATNSVDTQVAFQTAEGALNEATNNLQAGTYPYSSFLSNTQGLYVFNPSSSPLWSTVNWSDSSKVINSFQGQSNAQAAFIIEQLPSVTGLGQSMSSPARVYRITARAVGASGNTPVILQTTVQIQY